MSCNQLECNGLQIFENSVTPSVTPEIKMPPPKALLETLRALSKEELLTLLADVLRNDTSKEV